MSLGVEEWAVRVIQGMYSQYSEEFGVGVVVHQGSASCSLVFVVVLEVLSCKFHNGVPWELIFTNDLVPIMDMLEECIFKINVWKDDMESKGLHRKYKNYVYGKR